MAVINIRSRTPSIKVGDVVGQVLPGRIDGLQDQDPFFTPGGGLALGRVDQAPLIRGGKTK